MGNARRPVITGKPVTTRITSPAGGVRIETFIPWTLVKRGVRREVITPIDAPEAFREEARVEREQRRANQHSPLLRALGLAHYWQHLIDECKFRSLTDIAAAEEIDVAQVSRMARLTQVAPNIVEACIAGKDTELTLEHLIRRAVPVGWDEQQHELSSSRE